MFVHIIKREKILRNLKNFCIQYVNVLFMVVALQFSPKVMNIYATLWVQCQLLPPAANQIEMHKKYSHHSVID